MGRPYSQDLRKRVFDYIAAGRSRRAAGRVFGVSASTAVRLAASHRDRGDIAPKPQGRMPGTAGKLAPHIDFLVEIVRAEPDITLQELAGALAETHGVSVQLSSIHRALVRLACHMKKGLIAQERERPDLRAYRREWVARRQPYMREAPQRLAFIDETSVKTNMTRLRGRRPVGERPYGPAPFGDGRTQTFIAGLACNELIAPWVVPGALNRQAFDIYIESQLAPSLEPGTVVILDNLAAHKSPIAAAALRERSCWTLFLPAYPPDLNPIEMAFSKLKAHLRRLGARTYGQLIQALGQICDLFDPDECWNFFRAAGYAPD